MSLKAWQFEGGALTPITVTDWQETDGPWSEDLKVNGYDSRASTIGEDTLTVMSVKVSAKAVEDGAYRYVATLALQDIWESVFLPDLPALLAFLRYVEPILSLAVADASLEDRMMARRSDGSSR